MTKHVTLNHCETITNYICEVTDFVMGLSYVSTMFNSNIYNLLSSFDYEGHFEEAYMQIIKSSDIEEKDLFKCLLLSISEKLFSLSLYILSESELRDEYRFLTLEDIVHYLNSDSSFFLNRLNKQLRNKSYDQLIKSICPGMSKKLFGLFIKENGINGINNLHILSKIDMINKDNYQNFLNLDLQVSIYSQTRYKAQKELYKALVPYFTRSRLVSMFSRNTVPERSAKDILQSLLKLETIYNGKIPKKKLWRGTTTLQKFEENLTLLTILETGNNKKILNQDILDLDGKSFKDFQIAVPKSSGDLITTSLELKHCVYSYTNDIISKSCQVFNLLLKGKLTYTVELVPLNQYWKVVQIKGQNNDSVLESDEHKAFRIELIKEVNGIYFEDLDGDRFDMVPF